VERAAIATPAGVRLYVIGPFAVQRDGHPLARTAVGSRKTRMLLALLAVEPGRRVCLDRIVEALWAVPPRRPAEDVATLVSRVRQSLGADAVSGGRSGYRLGSEVRVDLDEADGDIDTAGRLLREHLDTSALEAALRALAVLDRGALLEDVGPADWAEPARTRHTVLLRNARHVASEAALRTGDTGMAHRISAAAVRADPYDEIACRLVMRTHIAAAEPARAIVEYERLRTRLATDLGVDPAAETRRLHVAVLREEAAGGGQPASNRPEAAPTARLFGRRGELAVLNRAWDRALTGRTGLVVVTGESGYGKTTLVDAFARSVVSAKALVAVARCHEAERSLPLEPIAALVSRLAAATATGLGAHPDAAVAAAAAELTTARPANLTRVYATVTNALRQLTGTRAVLLVVEDLQWADAAALEFLRYAVRRIDRARLLVVATVQEERRASPMRLLGDVAEHVRLRPWTPADIVELSAAYGSPQAAAEIIRRTGGHPLFAVQLLRAGRTTEVPAAVTAHVVNRLQDVGSKAEELLRASASLGMVVDPGLLAGLLGIGPVAATRRCQRALACHLIQPAGPVYVFGNDLIRQVLYESTPSPARRIYARLHQGAVEPRGGRPAAGPGGHLRPVHRRPGGALSS